MPRQELPVRARSLVAAARNVSYGKNAKKGRRLRTREEWQNSAWEFFDLVPEFHQGCAITGALLSRAKLVVVERQQDNTWVPTTNPVALQAGRELGGGEEGQAELLRNLGIHFSVAGGAYLLGPTNPDDVMNPDKWIIAASTELSGEMGNYRLNGKTIDDVWAIEIWKRHPRNHRKYDAPARAILPILSELVQLSKRQAAQIDSRLTGNGLFLLPSETEFPSTPVRRNPGDPDTMVNSTSGSGASGLLDAIIDASEEAIEDQSSPAATLPVFGSVPGEYIDKAHHYTFASNLDEQMTTMRLEAIRRIALGMDMPPEVLLGNAGSNHWNAWLSDENSVKIHAEPLLKVITSSLTSGYLRNALEGEVDDPTAFAFAADTSQMRMRPNRSKESVELMKLGELSPKATRRENGFDESDAPTDEERQAMLLWRIANGSTTPELVDAALKEAGVDLGIEITDLRPAVQARPLPSTREHPVREIPERPAAAVDSARFTALVYASEQMVDRALQRAGNRMKSKYGGLRHTTTAANRLHLDLTIPASDCGELLGDAWSCTETIADLVDPAALARALDFYTRSLIVGRREPSRASLAASLKLLLAPSEA